MFATKAVLAVTLMAAGGVTAGSIVEMQSQHRALTSPRPVAAVAMPSRLTAVPPDFAAESQVVTLEQVNVVAEVPRKPVRPRVAHPAASEAAPVPCSEWGSLATGPEGRQVRSLCMPGSS